MCATILVGLPVPRYYEVGLLQPVARDNVASCTAELGCLTELPPASSAWVTVTVGPGAATASARNFGSDDSESW